MCEGSFGSASFNHFFSFLFLLLLIQNFSSRPIFRTVLKSIVRSLFHPLSLLLALSSLSICLLSLLFSYRSFPIKSGIFFSSKMRGIARKLDEADEIAAMRTTTIMTYVFECASRCELDLIYRFTLSTNDSAFHATSIYEMAVVVVVGFLFPSQTFQSGKFVWSNPRCWWCCCCYNVPAHASAHFGRSLMNNFYFLEESFGSVAVKCWRTPKTR